MNPYTDTPRTDACPHCGAEEFELPVEGYRCGTEPWYDEDIGSCLVRSNICYANKNSQLKAEVKEIRAALGDDGRRTHKELIQLATKASQWRTWKEKYIDLRNAHIAEGQDPAGTIWEHADKLQRELKASQAEVERLRDSLNDCLAFLSFHGPVGSTPDTARLLQKRILATLHPNNK